MGLNFKDFDLEGVRMGLGICIFYNRFRGFYYRRFFIFGEIWIR